MGERNADSFDLMFSSSFLILLLMNEDDEEDEGDGMKREEIEGMVLL